MLLVHCFFKEERVRPFTIAGPPGLEARLNALWESAYPSVLRRGLPFPLLLRTWDVPGEAEVMGRKVRVIRAQHDRHAIAASIRIDADDHSLAFSGDTGWQNDIVGFVDGADVFICECTDVESGFWGHMSLEEVAEHRQEMSVKRLVLSHLSDESREAAVAMGSRIDVVVADDGMVLDLD
jgi:ribonuclease BN (tRNA processing enzyme)